MTSTLDRTSERSRFRNAAARLRANAGIDRSDAAAAVVTAPDVGAAARRLRDSNRWTERSPLEELVVVVEPVEEDPAVEVHGSAMVGSTASDPIGTDHVEQEDDEPVIFDLRVPVEIHLESQLAWRDQAARSDNDQRRRRLAERAAVLLAEIDAAKPVRHPW